MSTKAKRHIHKYRKVMVAGTKVFACSLPDCSHHMPKHMEDLVEGKNSICWQCDDKFVMDSLAMKMDNPICLSCRIGIDPNASDILNSLKDDEDLRIRNMFSLDSLKKE